MGLTAIHSDIKTSVNQYDTILVDKGKIIILIQLLHGFECFPKAIHNVFESIFYTANKHIILTVNINIYPN